MTSLFDSLDNLSDIQGLIDSGTRESEVLEYKTASQVFSNSDKNEIAKDVSTFANALGGSIVYGVATDKKDKSLPAAIEPIEVTNIETIDRVINSTVYPPISGLKKKLIPTTNPKIMVLDIPASDTPPHQCLGDKKYYRRSGTENLPMGHDLIALQFGRRLAPVLVAEINTVIKPELMKGAVLKYEEAKVRAIVVNRGRRVARDLLLVVLGPDKHLVKFANRSGNVHDISSLHSGRNALQYTATGVLHPGTNLSIAEIGLTLTAEFVRTHALTPLLTWHLYADEMDMQTGSVDLVKLGWADLSVPPTLGP
jgi:hypothetical protein